MLCFFVCIQSTIEQSPEFGYCDVITPPSLSVGDSPHQAFKNTYVIMQPHMLSQHSLAHVQVAQDSRFNENHYASYYRYLSVPANSMSTDTRRRSCT